MPLPPALPGWVAHTPSKKNPHWHLLTEHILDVAERAAVLANDPCLPPDWARYLGLLHDLGKFTGKFQQYLWQCHCADKGEGSRPRPGSAPHKQHGALAAWNDLKRFDGTAFALPLYGHHGGMETPTETHN